MKMILLSTIVILGIGSFANACVNLSGVYADPNDPSTQQVWTQQGCSSVSVHTRILNDPYLGTVDLDAVNWSVGRHPMPAPAQSTSDIYSFVGSTLVADYVGYQGEDGINCTDRHIYSLDHNRGLVQTNVYFCGARVILNGTGTTPRVTAR